MPLKTALLAALAAAAAPLADAAPAWNVSIANFASIAMSVTATAPNTIIIPLADNGQGANIARSTDGGKTFEALPGGTAGGAYLGGSAVGNSASAASFFGLFSSDEPTGYNFTAAKGVLGITSQSVEAFGSGSYGATGQTLIGGGNGVAVSTDGGMHYTFVNVTELTTSARYGAFPSAQTWYLSAGMWPNNEAQADGRPLSRRLTARLDVAGNPRMDMEHKVQPVPVPPEGWALANSTGWSAQIVKTSDGGKTWASVYSGDSFYFNGIDCGSETNCVAVGEADSGPEPGVRVFTTTDGGKTWTRTWFSSDAQDSGFSVRWASPTEVWVGGGHLAQTAFAGYVLHSTDSGKTWERITVPNAYMVSLTFASPAEGYGMGLNVESTTSFVTYH